MKRSASRSLPCVAWKLVVRKADVRAPEQALLYLTDCTLATVSSMAMQRSRRKGEYDRQISIAQTAIDWMHGFGIDLTGTRAADVVALYGGSVKAWAASFEPSAVSRKLANECGAVLPRARSE